RTKESHTGFEPKSGGTSTSTSNAVALESPRIHSPSRAQNDSPLRLRLASKVNPPGRPKKDMKQAAVNERIGRVWYEANEKAKDRAGQRDLMGFLDAMDHEQPPLSTVSARVAGIVVKDQSWDGKKATYKNLKNPVLILDAFYMLPSKLLERCHAALPVANKAADAVDVTTPTAAQAATATASGNSTVEVVQIAGVGQFSRTQIETFRRMENLKNAVEVGMGLRQWLLDKVLTIVPHEWQSEIKRVADLVLNTYPYASIHGYENDTAFNFSLLYRATPPCWLNDACIRVLCERLNSDFPTCRFGGIQTANQQSVRRRHSSPQHVDTTVAEYVRASLTDSDVETIMIPVNFPDTHWCSLIVRVSDKKIFYYDSMHQIGFMAVLADLAKSLKTKVLKNFDVMLLSNPIQTDLFSCGVFTCISFTRWVIPGVARNYSDSSMTLRRFGLFYYILTGRYDLLLEAPPAPQLTSARSATTSTAPAIQPPPTQPLSAQPEVDVLEMKAPVPTEEDTEMKDDDESLPATQRATG
ncbi:hypothetical protein BBJ28_00014191, partial [Nothophytophthora sp. Chile5]